MPLTEGDIETYLCEEVRKRFGRAYKWASPSLRGVPDRIVVLPDTAPFFVEVKKPDGELSPSQQLRINELRNLGQRVEVVWSFECVDSMLPRSTSRYLQACARDVLRDGIIDATAAGYEIVLHVHDEIVVQLSEPPQ